MDPQDEFTPENVAQVSDETAYGILLQGEFQKVVAGSSDMPNSKTFGEHLDRRLHNIAAFLYQTADERGLTVDEMAASYEEWLLEHNEQDAQTRASSLLYVKAWRFRKSEKGNPV